MNLFSRLTGSFFLPLAFLYFSFVSEAQEIYVPRKTYSEENRDIIQEIRNHSEEELLKISTVRKQMVRQVYYQRTNYLIKGLKERYFIADESLQKMVDDVMQRIIDNNNITHLPRRILIQKNPIPNAFCFGEGTFVITVGLLSRISNESQLGFALAHELAHYELDHVKNRILQQVENDFAKKTKQEMEKLLNGASDSVNVDLLRDLVYGESRFNRDRELQADSLGLIFFRNAQYNQLEALSLLSLLDSAEMVGYPLGPELFLPLHSSKYPFQDHWLRRRLSVYHKKYDNTMIFKNDSISSHPDIGLRTKTLYPLIEDTNQALNYQSEYFIYSTARLAEFESVESAAYLKQYDRCLHLALRLMSRYPADSYLISIVSKVLIELYAMKDTELFSLYVSRYTGYYSTELRLVNDFLHNITKDELGEMGYHFLNSQSHFDEDNEEHYFLLWKLCDLTGRKEVQKRVIQSYSGKFGKGKFYTYMR